MLRTSLVAQLAKNLPAMQETWIWSLGHEDPLEKGKATHSSILAWRIPWTGEIHGVAKSQTRPSDWHFDFHLPLCGVCRFQRTFTSIISFECHSSSKMYCSNTIFSHSQMRKLIFKQVRWIIQSRWASKCHPAHETPRSISFSLAPSLPLPHFLLLSLPSLFPWGKRTQRVGFSGDSYSGCINQE